jgi:hypothetical protein
VSAPYRDTASFDLERDRAIHAMRGAAIALMTVASWPIADLAVSVILDRLVGSGTALPSTSTRVALIAAARIVPAMASIAILHVAASRPRVPRSSGRAWIGWFVLAAASIASTYETMEITRATIVRLPSDKLTEWVKDFETVLRVEAFSGPIALLAILAWCLARWQRGRTNARTSCPHCHEPL